MLYVGFIVYGLALFSVLTFYRLPADKILSGTVESMTDGRVLVSSGKLSSTLWRGHHLEDLTGTIQSGNSVVVARMDYLTLSPNFLGLFQGYLPVNLKGKMAKGTFQMSAGISMVRGLDNGYASLEVVGIHLGDVEALSMLAQRQIKGKLTGRADLHGPLKELRKLKGRASILIEDGTVEARMDAFGFRAIPFLKLSLPLFVQDGVASLKEGRLTGPLFSGELEGRIRLLQDLELSPLQIRAAIRPGPSLAGEKGGNLPLSGDKPLVIRLEGTIGKPLFTFAGG